MREFRKIFCIKKGGRPGKYFVVAILLSIHTHQIMKTTRVFLLPFLSLFMLGCPGVQEARARAEATRSLSQMRSLVVTAFALQVEEDREVENIVELARLAGDPGLLRCPLSPDDPIGYVWVGLGDRSSDRIAIYSKGVTNRGERLIGFASGAAEIRVVPDEELPPGIPEPPASPPVSEGF